MSPDRRRVRVQVEVPAGAHSYSQRVLERVQRLLAAHCLRGFRTELDGPVKVFVQMVEEVQRTQLSSFASATLVVAVMVAVFLRSLSWALAAMLPTLFPVLVTLGAMGLAGVYLDMGTAMIAAVVLGIAIDDAVHLLTQYRRRLAAGSEPAEAIRAAVLHVGRAVVTTSLALSLGFFVLTLSSWESVASFGFLSGVAILIALVADLVILPAVIAARRRSSSGGGRLGSRTDRARWLASLLATLPVLAALALAGLGLLAPAAPGFPCRVLRNGAVPWLGSPDPGCPLRAYDRVLAVESAGGVRHGEAADELRRVAAASARGARVLVSRGRPRGMARARDPQRRPAPSAPAASPPPRWSRRAARHGARDPLGLGGSRCDARSCCSARASRWRPSRVLCGAISEALQIPGAIGQRLHPGGAGAPGAHVPARARDRAPLSRAGARGSRAGRAAVRHRPSGISNARRRSGCSPTARSRCSRSSPGRCSWWSARSRVRESGSALERARARVLLWGTLAVAAVPLAAASRGWAVRRLARDVQRRGRPAAAADRLRDRALPPLRSRARGAPRHRLPALRGRRERLRRRGAGGRRRA